MAAVIAALLVAGGASIVIRRSGTSEPSAAPPTITAPSTTAVVPLPQCPAISAPAAPPTTSAFDAAVAAGEAANDPFLMPGARPVPGPGMPTTTVPTQPIVIAVAEPPYPEEHAAAKQDSGIADGPVPEPKVSDGSTPTTFAPSATTTTAPVCVEGDAP